MPESLPDPAARIFLSWCEASHKRGITIRGSLTSSEGGLFRQHGSPAPGPAAKSARSSEARRPVGLLSAGQFEQDRCFSMLTLLALLSIAPEINRGFVYGDDLQRSCTAGFASDRASCEGYLTGVHDAVRAYEEWGNMREVCSPKKTSPQDLRDTVVDYLRLHPENLSGQAASVAVLAFRAKYPCSIRGPSQP